MAILACFTIADILDKNIRSLRSIQAPKLDNDNEDTQWYLIMPLKI